jgi:hypothetical protein
VTPYYWAMVAVLALAFAAVDLEALRRRSFSRWHGVSVAVYVAAWVVVAGLGLPVAPLGSLWWVFPVAMRLAVLAVFGGGQLLAGLVREEQSLAHPEQRPPKLPEPRLSEAELRTAEEYDAEWQLEDRERNRKRARLAPPWRA